METDEPQPGGLDHKQAGAVGQNGCQVIDLTPLTYSLYANGHRIKRGGGTGPMKPRQPLVVQQVPIPADSLAK